LVLTDHSTSRLFACLHLIYLLPYLLTVSELLRWCVTGSESSGWVFAWHPVTQLSPWEYKGCRVLEETGRGLLCAYYLCVYRVWPKSV